MLAEYKLLVLRAATDTVLFFAAPRSAAERNIEELDTRDSRIQEPRISIYKSREARIRESLEYKSLSAGYSRGDSIRLDMKESLFVLITVLSVCGLEAAQKHMEGLETRKRRKVQLLHLPPGCGLLHAAASFLSRRETGHLSPHSNFERLYLFFTSGDWVHVLLTYRVRTYLRDLESVCTLRDPIVSCSDTFA